MSDMPKAMGAHRACLRGVNADLHKLASAMRLLGQENGADILAACAEDIMASFQQLDAVYSDDLNAEFNRSREHAAGILSTLINNIPERVGHD